VLLVCSGLDHARRGFESFARECFETLRHQPGIRIELVKGSGPRAPGERSLPTLRRDRAVALALGRALGARPFRIEALSLAISLLPLIAARVPDVVYMSEWDTARALAVVRSVLRQQFKLLLCNGTFAAGGFDHLDRVQDLTPAAREYVIRRGADPRRHVVLPLGFRMPARLAPLTADDRAALRRRLGLPVDRKIVISVAALNRHHKRLDYVIEEIASIRSNRPFLLLAGQPEEETPGLRALAAEHLHEDHEIRTVPADRVGELCLASDAFVLASFYEGLPRALVEASALGLPCLTHAYPIPEFVLGPYGYSADLRERGALARLIDGVSEADLAFDRRALRHGYAYERFSWDRLAPRYVELLRDVASSPTEP
jgi:glycosyltransferase involved in cell wall biosynthesis